MDFIDIHDTGLNDKEPDPLASARVPAFKLTPAEALDRGAANMVKMSDTGLEDEWGESSLTKSARAAAPTPDWPSDGSFGPTGLEDNAVPPATGGDRVRKFWGLVADMLRDMSREERGDTGLVAGRLALRIQRSLA